MADRDTPETTRPDPAKALTWHQPIDAIPPQGLEVTHDASEAELGRLRDAFDLVDLPAMSAQFTIRPWRKTGFSVKGQVDADVVRACVVTLEPVTQTVREEVDVKLVPAREAEKWLETPDEEGEIVIDPEAEDPPDFFEGHALDLGKLAAEYVALGLDPYPRAPGVEFEAAEEEAAGEAGEPSPFAGLKDMMQKRALGRETE